MSTKIVKPYGDTLNDGKMQLSFALPVSCDAFGKEAARILLIQMGFDNAEITGMRNLNEGFTHFIAYAATSVGVDTSKIKVKVVETPVMDMETTDAFIAEHLGRKITVVGACIESDAHTVGIDAIMNMKGYNHRYGLERYHLQCNQYGCSGAIGRTFGQSQGTECRCHSGFAGGYAEEYTYSEFNPPDRIGRSGGLAQ